MSKNRFKGTVDEVNEDMNHGEAFEFISEVKERLTEKGRALNMGTKHGTSTPSTKIATLNEESGSVSDTELISSRTPEDRVAFTRSKPGWRKQFREPEQSNKRGCYTCGGKHIWRMCPDKQCPSFGQKGHVLKDCSTNAKVRTSGQC